MTAARSQLAAGTVVYFALVIALLVGLVLVALGAWRLGVGLCGLAFVVAASGRAVLGEDAAGLLRVRRRWFDVAWMTFLGVSLALLAVIVPKGF